MNSGNENLNDVFVKLSGMSTVILDGNARIVSCNDEFLNLTGMSLAKVTNSKWDDIIIYDYPYTPLENKDIFGTSKIVPSGKFWCSIKNKNPRKIVSGTLTFNHEEGLYYAAFYDISEQIKSDRLIYDGGLLIGSLADNLGGAMAFHNSDGIIKFASRGLCSMVGVEKKNILGRHIGEFFDSDLVEKWLFWMNCYPNDIPRSVEFNSSKRNEVVFHAMATPRIFFGFDKNVAGCMFIFSDITELKETEQKLRISDERYRKTFTASPAPSSITTLKEGRYIEVNESYEKLVGYSREELIGTTTLMIKFLDQAERRKFVRDLYLKGKLRDYEAQIYSKIGGVRTFSLSAELIELQGEKCIIWVGYDVTENIRLEKEILSITGRERYKIGEALHDDLGQLVVGVEAMSSLLHKRLVNKDMQEAQLAGEINSYLKDAHEQIRGMARGLCPLRLEEHGLSSGIMDLVSETKKIFNVECKFFNFNEHITIYNSQVAINMFYITREAVMNAVKHGKSDSITIAYYSNEGNIYISVKDNGKGFDVADISGIGMGLNLMKYRARAIGGSVSIKSTLQKGSTVILKFPMNKNEKNEWDWKLKTYEEITNINS